ncbi:transmembrane protein, putative [Bodo saltans]|uniref:Transmembrane protein, putative n=1 Tax=Bodo saltans TaxID=75058 RepID=A0A0S4IJ18_BODSA|nr:transmembrane protein, putative [Bodo saltans]|eukprot:CUE74181.1 transmembrane protein, putative [Bodo saltans]
MGAAGTADGFGSSARFTQPEGIALIGAEYGWPCLYVHEEFPAYIREVRLRDPYVRTIPLIGLPVGFDIEGIVSYTNRTSGEFGLLLMNYHVSGNRAQCQVTVTVLSVVLALCFCVASVAGVLGVSFATASHLVLLEVQDDKERFGLSLKALFVTKQYQWKGVVEGIVVEGQGAMQSHFAVLLNEFRLLWYCVGDLVALLAVGVLAGVAQSSQDLSVCAGCGVATACLYLVQFGVCVRSRPFMSMFGNVYGALMLLLKHAERWIAGCATGGASELVTSRRRIA